MVLLVIVPLWLLLLVLVSGLCRAARAGDQAAASSAPADPYVSWSGGRAPNLLVGSGETKNSFADL
jgi:hypothetical protein